ncbi:MAG: hypothetical protein IPP72_18480 [Chitinophagaceae bacterium]|nr:hypothetical protein [Chitinophagaceae bacterium]
MAKPTPPHYHDSVFINYPFDTAYQPIIRALLFTIYRCGFLPVTALAEDNALDNRLAKIEKLIGSCKYGIHDISRIETSTNGMPRFNMPFELGLFFGARRFGNKIQREKNALIFDSDNTRYRQFISDLSGVDIKAHQNNPAAAIRSVAEWLSTASKRSTIPGYKIIVAEYAAFEKGLPLIVEKLGLDIIDIPFNNYCLIVEETIKGKLSK